MKNLQMDNLTPLTQEELMQVEGGGILESALGLVGGIANYALAIVWNAANAASGVLKGIVDILI